METTTSANKKSMKYGFLINPSTYCKVINVSLQEELLLSPGIQYYIPWDREDTKVESVEVAATGSIYPEPLMPPVDQESLNWLKIAERSFKFWDNEIDEVWNNV